MSVGTGVVGSVLLSFGSTCFPFVKFVLETYLGLLLRRCTMYPAIPSRIRTMQPAIIPAIGPGFKDAFENVDEGFKKVS